NHYLVRNKVALVHDRLCRNPGGRCRFNGGAQHVSGRQLRDLILLLEPRRLCAFPGSGRSKKNQSHRRLPRNLAFFTSPSYWCACKWPMICDTVSIMTLTTMRREVP